MRARRVGLLLGGAAAFAMTVAAGEAAEKKVEKRIKVIVTDDGDEKVIEQEIGPGGAHAFAFAGSGGGRLGVGLADVAKEDVARLKLEEERGALVKTVEKDSAADEAGLAEGDVIVRFQGEIVRSAAALARMVSETPPHRTVALEVVRAGTAHKLSATLREAKGPFEFFLPHGGGGAHPPMPPLPPMPPSASGKDDRVFRWESEDGEEPMVRMLHSEGPPRLGVRLQDVEGQLATFFKLPGDKGVLVTSVDAESAAAKAGVKAGDIIRKFEGVTVSSASELRRAVRKAEGGKALALSVWRDGKAVELSVALAVASERPAPRPASKI